MGDKESRIHYAAGQAEEREGGRKMSKDERKERIENIAEEFSKMDDTNKVYIIGYITGVREERAKWEKREKNEAVTTPA